jgi:hypothetical protein
MKTMRTFRNTVDLDKFSTKDVDILDIAHGLSQICRYNGACPMPYYVGDHAIRVADRVWDRTRDPLPTLLALHHDDTEIYIGDQIRPIKDSLFIKLEGAELVPFSVYEDQLLDVVLGALIPPEAVRTSTAWAMVREADDEVLQEEMFHMWGTVCPDQALAPHPKLHARTSHEAERDFLFAHRRLLMQFSPPCPLATGDFR